VGYRSSLVLAKETLVSDGRPVVWRPVDMETVLRMERAGGQKRARLRLAQPLKSSGASGAVN
jgi:hypothetical protein